MLTEYDVPYPPCTDEAPDDGSMCPAKSAGYGCTRSAGHEGRHEAGTFGNQIVASWPAEADDA